MIIPGAVLDIVPAYGWIGGPQFETKIARTVAGRESRMARNDRVIHQFSLPYLNIRGDDYLRFIKSLFLVTRGRTYGFLAKDHSDWRADSAPFAVGDGVQDRFQLAVTSTIGAGSYRRVITKPMPDASVAVDESPASATIDPMTGEVVFASAPAAGAPLTWSGGFWIPVRFDSDALPMSIDNRFGSGGEYAMNGKVDVTEVFDE